MFFKKKPDTFSVKYHYYHSAEPQLSGGMKFYPVYRYVTCIENGKIMEGCGGKFIHDYYDTREKAEAIAMKLNEGIEDVL